MTVGRRHYDIIGRKLHDRVGRKHHDTVGRKHHARVGRKHHDTSGRNYHGTSGSKHHDTSGGRILTQGVGAQILVYKETIWLALRVESTRTSKTKKKFLQPYIAWRAA